MNFLGQGFQKLESKQDRQTDRHMTERITTAAFVGDINKDWHAMVNQILRNNSHLAY